MSLYEDEVFVEHEHDENDPAQPNAPHGCNTDFEKDIPEEDYQIVEENAVDVDSA